MIESLLEELPQRDAPDEVPDSPASDPGRYSEHSFFAALSIVQRIVGGRRLRLDSMNGPDIVQEVALRLWRWRRTHQEQSEKMSINEWNAYAARTAYNEVNRYFSEAKNAANVQLDVIPEIEGPSVEGQTEVEVFSLIQQVWQATCQLSLRQRRALLLHSQELVIYFLQIGITENDIADALDFNETVWCAVRDRLPMTDIDIAEIAEGTAGSIKKARYEARVKLEGSIRR